MLRKLFFFSHFSCSIFSFTGKPKIGGCLASISASPWPVRESSTHSWPVRCSVAKRACASPSTTTWSRFVGQSSAHPSAWQKHWRSSVIYDSEERSGEDGVLPGADFCILLAAPSSQSNSEENSLRWERPQPLWAAQVRSRESLMRSHCSW